MRGPIGRLDIIGRKKQHGEKGRACIVRGPPFGQSSGEGEEGERIGRGGKHPIVLSVASAKSKGEPPLVSRELLSTPGRRFP